MAATPRQDVLSREHTWAECIFIVFSLAFCITTDILQYSMPLAFLPSVLEDRGHRMQAVSAVIGVYYWTGFLGGVLITSYQIYRVVRGQQEGDETMTTVPTARRRICYLIAGLSVGMVTLTCQAVWPYFRVHAICRFIQGLAGAFIFFYCFILCVELFHGTQQVFAMTALSCALNVAEVLGSMLGALVFDTFGHRAVFWSLVVASILNQGMLILAIIQLKPAPHVAAPEAGLLRAQGSVATTGWQRLKGLLCNRMLHLSVAIIVAAAMVKGCVESALPFHADHEWGYTPIQIGQVFFIIAIAYILSAAAVGQLWTMMGRMRISFSAACLAGLGFSCWGLFSLAAYGMGEGALNASLVFYGIFLGLTHTPAALLLAEAIDEEENGPSKDAVNGIWNTMWEAGGSIGFLLASALGKDYQHQVRLMIAMCISCTTVAGIILSTGFLLPQVHEQKKAVGYGCTA